MRRHHRDSVRAAVLALAALGAVVAGARPAGAFEAAIGSPPAAAYRVTSVEIVEEGGEVRQTTLTATARPPLRPRAPWRATDLAGEHRAETPRGPIARKVVDPRFGALATALLAGLPPRRVTDGTVVYRIPLEAVAGGTGTDASLGGKFISLTPSALANREGRRELDTAARGRVTVNMMGMALVVSYRASVSLDLATGVPVRGELSWHGEQAGNRLFSRREIITFSRR